MATSNRARDMELDYDVVDKDTETGATVVAVDRTSFPRRREVNLPIALAATRNAREPITATMASGSKRRHVLMSPSDSSLSPVSQMLVGNNRRKVAKKASAKLLWHGKGREVATNSTTLTATAATTAKTPVARSKFPRRRVTGPSSAVARARNVGRAQGPSGHDAGGNDIRNMLMSPTDSKLSPTSQMLLGNSRIAIGPKDRAQLLWGNEDKDTDMSRPLPSSSLFKANKSYSSTPGPAAADTRVSSVKKRRVVMSPTNDIISPISRLLVGGGVSFGERTKAAKKASTKLMWNVITTNIAKANPTDLPETQTTAATGTASNGRMQVNVTKTPVSRTSLPRRRLTGPASAIKRLRQDFLGSPTDTLSPMSRLLIGNKGIKIGKKETAKLLWNQHGVDTAAGTTVAASRVASRGPVVSTTTTPHAGGRSGFPRRRPSRVTGPASLSKRVSQLGLTKSPSDAQVSPMTRMLVGNDRIKAAAKTRAKLLWHEVVAPTVPPTMQAPVAVMPVNRSIRRHFTSDKDLLIRSQTAPPSTSSVATAVVAMDLDNDDVSKSASKMVEKKKKKKKKKTSNNASAVGNKKQPRLAKPKQRGAGGALPFVVADEENTNRANQTGTAAAVFVAGKTKKATKKVKHVVAVSGGTVGLRMGARTKIKLAAGEVDKMPSKRVSKGPLTARHINVL